MMSNRGLALTVTSALLLLNPPAMAAPAEPQGLQDCAGRIDFNCWGPNGFCHLWVHVVLPQCLIVIAAEPSVVASGMQAPQAGLTPRA